MKFRITWSREVCSLNSEQAAAAINARNLGARVVPEANFQNAFSFELKADEDIAFRIKSIGVILDIADIEAWVQVQVFLKGVPAFVGLIPYVAYASQRIAALEDAAQEASKLLKQSRNQAKLAKAAVARRLLDTVLEG